MKSGLRILLLLCGFCRAAIASHIAGGNIELVALTKPGQFQLSLNLYIDDASKGPEATINPTITVSVFRQRDHKLMGDYVLKLGRRLGLVYANPACARSRGLETSEIRYSSPVQLDPALFDDPAGYYIVWETCCRNQNVTNVDLPQTRGMIYYLSFPALRQNGQYFRNSSPVFLTPNAEYICVDKPFSLAFRATDADGDQLRYSLVTPYNDNIYKPVGFANSPASPPYRVLPWQSGYSANRAITGNPALQISASGVLTVRPDRIGLYAFTVLCEEFRPDAGGALQKIGEVRRDHQILVVDCSPQVPPKPVVAALGPAGPSPVEFCAGSFALLGTESNPAFNYQWRVNGYNLPGETKQTLRATQPGDYTVLKSFATVCTRDSVSDTFVLTLKPSPLAHINAVDTLLCPQKTVALQANTGPGLQYKWALNGADQPGAASALYTASKAGRYTLKLFSEATGCTALDSINIVNDPLQQAVIRATVPGSALCDGNSLSAVVVQSPGSLTYVWQRDGQFIAATPGIPNALAGTYLLTVRDSACSLASAPALVNPRPHPVLDSIPPVCGTIAAPVPMRGTPTGGTFGGLGVAGNLFNPKLVGPGSYTVTYSVVSSAGCRGDTSRVVNVLNVPTPDLGGSQTIIAGGRVVLQGPSGPGLTYAWEPITGLISPTGAAITIQPEQTTTYRLTVSQNGLCPLSAEVLIEVLPGLFVPTAFTPNGDGQNDTWQLTGVGAFPQCVVRVYNRWGEVVLDSPGYREPWDGRYRGQPVEQGVYQFVIRPAPDQPEKRGTVMILDRDF